MAVYRSDQAQVTFGSEAAPGAYPGMATSVSNGTGNTTLASAHNAGSHKITVASTTGITAGEDIKIGGASNTESEIRRVEYVDSSTVLYLDAPTAHYHASSAAVQVVTATTTTANEVYMNQIPGVYDTVEVPEMTPTLEPRYFLGTQSKRDFFAVYKGQQAFTGSISGFVLLNGRALRYPFGKVVTKPNAVTARTYLSTDVRKGDVFITVASATNFAVDDLVVIDYVSSPLATSVSEVRKILAISSTTFQLDYPLTFAHTAAGSGQSQIQEVSSGTTYDHHIFEQVDLDTVSWHVHMRDSGETAANDFDRTYFGGLIGSATIAADEGGMLNMSWDGVNFQGFKHNQMLGNSTSSSALVPHAGVMQSITATNIEFPTTNPYFFSQGSVTMFGVEMARVRSFNLGVSNGEEPRYYIQKRMGNKRGPTEIREQRREYTLGVTLALPDSQASATGGNTLFKEFLTEGDFGSGMQGFNIVLEFRRSSTDKITITIPDDGTAATGGNQQGAFFRSAPHAITGDNPVQVDADILVRNVKILVTDSLYYYP